MSFWLDSAFSLSSRSFRSGFITLTRSATSSTVRSLETMSSSSTSTCVSPPSTLDLSTLRTWGDMPKNIVHQIIPRLSPKAHKGSYGRIGILGGSEQYTGAPYYAAMSALNTGADLAYVFCAHEASIPLKGYSPELMVSPVYDTKAFDQALELEGNKQHETTLVEAMVSKVTEMFPKMHCLIVGPGLGRHPLVIKATSKIIQKAISSKVPLVLDADALHILTLDQYRYILAGDENTSDDDDNNRHEKFVVLTPNVVECQRLLNSFEDVTSTNERNLLEQTYENVLVVEKGNHDTIHYFDEFPWKKKNADKNESTNDSITCHEPGGLKRSGGLGDILSGAIGTHVAWNNILMSSLQNDKNQQYLYRLVSCWSACCLTKQATKRAFDNKRRAMQAPDVLEEIGSAFESTITPLLPDETEE